MTRQEKKATQERRILRIGDGSGWHFINGRWQDGENGLLQVPEKLRRSDGDSIQGHHYAFHRGLWYEDVRVRFEFLLNGHSDIGVILRARDESHFYLLHFPCCGQARRAQHFWAAFSRMDNSGYLRCIKLEMVRRVPSFPVLWLSAEVVLQGTKITVRIGDNGYFEAEDDTYAGAGVVGFYSTGDAQLRNIMVEGEPSAPYPWNDRIRQPTNWFHPVPDGTGPWQKPQDLLRLPDGELLLSYIEQRTSDQSGEAVGTQYLVRSRDRGASWSVPERVSLVGDTNAWFPPRFHLTPAGRLIALMKGPDGYSIAESIDRARTWSEPQLTGVVTRLPHLAELYVGPQAFLNLADDSMVLFGYGGHDLKNPDLTTFTWGATHCQACACRSTDDGRTWSPWVNIDNLGMNSHGKQYDGSLDLTEVCGAQMRNGHIMALIRPIYSPWMWETWSHDGGATWGPCIRGPFPGYATPNMLRTSSGTVLVAHRLPNMTVNCSRDDGHTWDQGTLIDNAIWCMGAMVEVEPDVVLYVYWDAFESLMRAQFIRVTPNGLEPVRA